MATVVLLPAKSCINFSLSNSDPEPFKEEDSGNSGVSLTKFTKGKLPHMSV